MIIYATGFDAITGCFDRIDIRGRGGRRLKDQWADGPQTFLGLQSRASQPVHAGRAAQRRDVLQHPALHRAECRLGHRAHRAHARAGPRRVEATAGGGAGLDRARLRDRPAAAVHPGRFLDDRHQHNVAGTQSARSWPMPAARRTTARSAKRSRPAATSASRSGSRGPGVVSELDRRAGRGEPVRARLGEPGRPRVRRSPGPRRDYESGHLAWLEEFLGPAFERADSCRADWRVSLVEDRERYRRGARPRAGRRHARGVHVRREGGRPPAVAHGGRPSSLFDATRGLLLEVTYLRPAP